MRALYTIHKILFIRFTYLQVFRHKFASLTAQVFVLSRTKAAVCCVSSPEQPSPYQAARNTTSTVSLSRPSVSFTPERQSPSATQSFNCPKRVALTPGTRLHRQNGLRLLTATLVSLPCLHFPVPQLTSVKRTCQLTHTSTATGHSRNGMLSDAEGRLSLSPSPFA